MDFKNIQSRISSCLRSVGDRLSVMLMDRDLMRLTIAVLVILGFLALALSFGKMTL
jgi:hypothetical protein